MRFDTIRLFLWGYAKVRVYADKPSSLEHLKTNIRQVMAEIPPNMCQKVVENYLKRISACNTWRGGHLNDVVFHIHIMSTFKLCNKKEKYHEKIIWMCFIYIHSRITLTHTT